MREKPIAGAWIVESQPERPAFYGMADVLSIRLRPGRYYVVTDNKKAAAELPDLFASPMVIACSQQRRWHGDPARHMSHSGHVGELLAGRFSKHRGKKGGEQPNYGRHHSSIKLT